MINVILKPDFAIYIGNQYVMDRSDDVDMVTVAQNITDALNFHGVTAEVISLVVAQ